MSPCSDGIDGRRIDTEHHRHHAAMETLLEQLLADPRTPESYRDIYNAERKRHERNLRDEDRTTDRSG